MSENSIIPTHGFKGTPRSRNFDHLGSLGTSYASQMKVMEESPRSMGSLRNFGRADSSLSSSTPNRLSQSGRLFGSRTSFRAKNSPRFGPSDMLKSPQQTDKILSAANFLIEKKYPLIVDTALGQLWSKDIFAVPYNGLRRELRDMNLLMILYESMPLVSIMDFHNLLDWFKTFREIALMVLYIDDEVVFPWSGEHQIHATVVKSKRTLIRKLCKGMLLAIEDYRNKVHSTNASSTTQTVKEIYGITSKITILLLNYFHEVEDHLPKLILNTRIRKEVGLLHASVWDLVCQIDSAEKIYPCFLRAIDHPSAREDWIKDDFPGKKNKLMLWNSRFEGSHIAFVRKSLQSTKKLPASLESGLRDSSSNMRSGFI